MAHAQKPDFVFPRNGRVHLNRHGRQFSRLLAAEVCASAVVMLGTPCSEVASEYWLPIPFASFPFTSRASPCAIRFQSHYINHAFLPTVISITLFPLRYLVQMCSPAPWSQTFSIFGRFLIWETKFCTCNNNRQAVHVTFTYLQRRKKTTP